MPPCIQSVYVLKYALFVFLQVLELLPKDTLEAQMAEIIPGLLRVRNLYIDTSIGCVNLQINISLLCHLLSNYVLFWSHSLRGVSVIFSVFQGYDDQQSTVRKSAVFCLVAIYLKVGEGIWNHLTKLNYSKVSTKAVEKTVSSSDRF